MKRGKRGSPRRRAPQATQPHLNLLLLHRNLRLTGLLTRRARQLAHNAILEALRDQRRVKVVNVQVRARQPQTAAVAANLLLKDVVEEGIRVVKRLVAAGAGVAGIGGAAASFGLDVRGEEDAARVGQAGVRGD